MKQISRIYKRKGHSIQTGIRHVILESILKNTKISKNELIENLSDKYKIQYINWAVRELENTDFIYLDLDNRYYYFFDVFVQWTVRFGPHYAVDPTLVKVEMIN